MVQDVQWRLQDIHAEAAARIAMQQNAIFARDGRRDVHYADGAIVLVFNPAGKKGKATKLLSRWYGPYRVLRQTSPVNYEVETQGLRRKRTFIAHVGKMKPFRDRDDLFVD